MDCPSSSTLQAITATGADLVCFSGGKAIRGVQSSGILCGRGDLISAAALQMLDMDDHWELWEPPANLIDKSRLSGIPRHGIGRGFKLSKEEIVALLTGLQLFVDGAYDAEYPAALGLLRSIADDLAGLPFVCEIEEDEGKERHPLLTIDVDEKKLKKSALEICRDLRNGTPPIYLGHGMLRQSKLTVNPLHLDDEDAVAIARGLKGLA